MNWTRVIDRMPTAKLDDPHLYRLLLSTKRFGVFLGFFDGYHFRTNYAEILEGVTHWMEVPPVNGE